MTEILSTNRANERPHEGTLKDLIQLSKLVVILKFISQKNKQGRNYIHTQQKKGLEIGQRLV